MLVAANAKNSNNQLPAQPSGFFCRKVEQGGE
jgi:hypothetical protein